MSNNAIFDRPLINFIVWAFGVKAEVKEEDEEVIQKTTDVVLPASKRKIEYHPNENINFADPYFQEYMTQSEDSKGADYQNTGESYNGHDSVFHDSAAQLVPRALIDKDDKRKGGGSPSPQWGFYVSITPPQQELFSEFVGESTIDNPSSQERKNKVEMINARHRKEMEETANSSTSNDSAGLDGSTER